MEESSAAVDYTTTEPSTGAITSSNAAITESSATESTTAAGII